MIIKTKDLTGVALDWAVAKAVGQDLFTDGGGVLRVGGLAVKWSPSTNWSQCGVLIEQYEIEIGVVDGFGWLANVRYREEHSHYHCTSPLIAACRAIVDAELGDSVDVPDELVGEAS